MNNIPDNRIYYAQNREDLILESFFPDLQDGFYVDVGACHPDVASVTKRFYLKGWHGVNIEPQTNLFNLFTLERPRDTNLNIGVSDKKTNLTLRNYVNNQGMSTLTPALKNKYDKTSQNKTEEYEDISVEVNTLENIFSELRVKSIQFLKVDVEGHEYQVLKGNNWSKFRPEVVCIEADHVVKDWRPLLQKNSYKKIFFDGLNEYYVDSRTNRAEKFNFIGHVLMDLRGGISAEDYQRLPETKDSLNLNSQDPVKKIFRRIKKSK